MIFSKQGFVEAYACLSHGIQKQSANQYILALEKSDQALRIACELIDDPQLTHRLYGAQLFSKRVTSGLPTNTDSLEVVRFLLAAISKNPTDKLVVGQLCLSIAKILASSKSCLESFLKEASSESNLQLYLSIVKELPQCLSEAPEGITSNSQERQTLYNSIEPLLIRSLENPTKVKQGLTCLENFAEFCHVRVLQSARVVDLIVRLPIESTCTLLTYCFGQLSEGSVSPQAFASLANYVLATAQLEHPPKEFVPMFLEFIRFYITHDSNISLATLQLILVKTLQFITDDREHIINTFEFWMDLEKLTERRQDASQMIFEAMLQLNRIVVVQSKLSKLIPRNISTDQDHQVVDVDDEGAGECDLDPLALNFQALPVADGCLSFREYATDFLMLCFRCIRKLWDVEVKYFQELNSIVGQDPLSMELCIFILKSIVDQLEPRQYPLTYPIFNKLFASYDFLSDELMVPLLQLLFDCDKVLFSSDELFVSSLLFFSKIFQNRRLMRLSTQTLSNIVAELEVAGSAVKGTIEEFTGVIYGQLEHYSDETVLENLISAVITLIIKFDDPCATYYNFLQNYGQKVALLEPAKRLMHEKALFPSHQRIVHAESLHRIMATFVEASHQNLLADYLKEQDKKFRSQYIMVFNSIAKSCGQYIPSVMIEIESKLLFDDRSRDFSQIGSLYFLSNILSYEEAVTRTYLPFLTEVWEPVSYVLMALPFAPERTKVMVSIGGKLLRLVKDHSVSTKFVLNVLRTAPFNYELVRQILKYFISLARDTETDLREVIRVVLERYELYADPFYRTISDLLFEAFKKGGQQLFAEVFREVKPVLLPPNPLFASLTTALREEDGKTVKNVMMCLHA